MDESLAYLTSILKDLIKLNAIMATEMIQLVENSSRQLRGQIPESCLAEHGRLRQEIVAIVENWNGECCALRQHNLKHDQ